MKLKSSVDLIAFLKDVKRCRGEVTFHTPEGDHLNLKSMLSLYIFSAAAGNTAILEKGDVACADPEDEKLLAVYFA